jgi:PAS domain S-box-containing protein
MDHRKASSLGNDAGKPSAGSVVDRILEFIGTCHAKPLAWRLAVALAAVFAAIAIRAVFLDVFGDRLAYVTLFPAIAIAALLGGFVTGVLATIAGAVLAHFLISPVSSGVDLTGLAAFLASSFLILAMAEAIHISRVRIAGQAWQNAQQMRDFVERVPAAIAMFDTDMRYLAASARWRSDFNIETDPIGRSHYEVFPRMSQRWKDIHRRALAGHGLGPNEERFTRFDGSTLWLRWEIQPWYGGHGAVGGITIFCENLTERKRTEEQLARTQQMELVGKLSGGVAHDFNNLLTAILGNAELLEQQLRPRQDLLQLAESIGRAADRGAELTHQLLAFGRRQLLRPVEIDCNDLLGGIRERLRRSLRDDIEIRVDLAAGLPAAFADPAELEAAVTSLALNAQEAMTRGGRLTIATGAASLNGRQDLDPDVSPGDYVVIAVTDDGEGIPQEVLGRVFEPFFTTREIGQGSGLGLSMVYGFAKQSDGHVTIESKPGLGTTVRIYLPWAGPETSMAGSRRQTVQGAGGARGRRTEDGGMDAAAE